ncbi:hypothetical protein G3N95_31550 [Paraburkholderia sp. Tr-20389]|uniref:hypothetical protein n=1 Tax=Paraburkholderia sp. Tr-20389 TaxID=2703903 RepID=UPI00197EF2BD|nr:hypothetical protein [Paraburkholderia sp. Tr-20389]MBN3757499.1 hypothetical protein [Paraburkholderia sp. Tr-20389]
MSDNGTATETAGAKGVGHTQDNYKGIFDISDADGVNESERLLMRLCRRSFLSLWSFANLHTDQDMRDGRGSAKEFADVLVVFGNDVVIFSDKHVAFQQDQELSVAWKRWYKRAVSSSAKQLHGAMGWASRFPHRVYLDSACQRPLPVSIPDASQARYHLVAVTRGSVEACATHFAGSRGTLVINTEVKGPAHENFPFTVGVVTPGKEFVHVFDEISLEFVLRELDTVSDFVAYLSDRRALLDRPETGVIAPGEEQLLAAYLRNGDELRRSFLPTNQQHENPGLILFDERQFEGLMGNPQYVEKKRLDRPSYFWDALIENFIRLGDPNELVPYFHQENADLEEGLRLLARESRFRRRILSDACAGALRSARAKNARNARLFTTDQEPTTVYVFLIQPKDDEDDYAAYRRHRIAVLHAYTKCAKLRFPEGTTFIGLAFDHPNKNYRGSSEDLFVFNCEHFSDEDRAEAERYRRDLGIVREGLEVKRMHASEYPDFITRADTAAQDAKFAQARQEKRKRNRAKMAKASKRRNRK